MKYLLCRPDNGLNDILCAINDCYLYCCKYNRILLVDTKKSFFTESFDTYFNISNKSKIKIIINSDIIKNILDDENSEIKTIYPNIPKSELNTYKKTDYNIINNNIISYADLSNYYEEDLIIFDYYSCGEGSFNLFKILRLNENIINEFHIRFNSIEKPYSSTHFRHTDHIDKNNYFDFYNEHKSIIDNNNFFLATDNLEVLNYFKSLNIKLYSFIKCLSNQTSNYTCYGIHTSPITNKNDVMIDTICDLLIMSLSNKFIKPKKIIGGFTQLAINLNNNKDVVWKFLYDIKLKYFITFGSGNYNYYNAVNRLTNQANSLNIFKDIKGYTDIDLKNDNYFWNKHSQFIENNCRGYGYWLWKPYIIKKRMETIEDGDILLYLDSGCEIDIKKKDLINHYMELVQTELIIGTYTAIEKGWNKMDLIVKLDMLDDKYLENRQHQAGAILISVCNKTRNLINMWYDLACDYHNIDDSPSITSNLNSFIEHRHDQSIFSLLTKKYNLYSTYTLDDCIEYIRNNSNESKI